MAEPDDLSLEAQYEIATLKAVAVCKSLGYDPTAWITMTHRYGAAEAARRLLVSGDIQSGFQRLVDIGHPELTIEWSALESRWEPLFQEDVKAAARWRLAQAGIEL